MEILFLESFYGGSHRDVADAIAAHSRHHVHLHTLPARFWKWRMRGAALHFAHEIDEVSRYDLVVCTGLMSVADFRSLTQRGPGPRFPPVLLYAHETQLSYPAPSEREGDLHFAFTDLTNMLAADGVTFNSRSHRDAYLEALPRFLRKLPEYRPTWALEEVRAKSSYCYPGIRLTDGPRQASSAADPAPLIVWNHRWEFDKDPETFFAALGTVKDRGVRFRLALLGENFQVVPRPFLAARKTFEDEIVQYGFVPDRRAYEAWLARADVVVSTSVQENFGISVVEAIAYGASPLLPRRLSYPEIIPERFHDALYADEEDLVEKLVALLTGSGKRGAPPELVRHARSFRWEDRIREFDALFERVAEAPRA